MSTGNCRPFSKELLDKNLVDDAICTFCKSYNENLIHVYYECDRVKHFWSQIRLFINNSLKIDLNFTKYVVMFGVDTHHSVINHILLVAKRYIYISSIKQQQ